MNLSSHEEKAVNKPAGDWSDLSKLVAVMDMLRTLIEEENAFLRTGLPSSLFAWHDAKQDLADQYADLTARVSKCVQGGRSIEKRRLKSLIDETLTLKGLADENLRLLDGAITASRRRVEAVLSAVQQAQRPYGGKTGSLAGRLVYGSSRMSV
jgi:hypothetical protein